MKINFKQNPPTPFIGQTYIVYVPEYCSSGLQIATWGGKAWENDASADISEYVLSWELIEAL